MHKVQNGTAHLLLFLEFSTLPSGTGVMKILSSSDSELIKSILMPKSTNAKNPPSLIHQHTQTEALPLALAPQTQ